MANIEEFIIGKSKGQIIGAWVGAILFLTFGFWQFSISATMQEINRYNTKLEELEGQEIHKRKLLNQKTKLKKIINELNVRYSNAVQELPESRDFDKFLSSISNLAKDSGLEIELIEPKSQSLKDFYAELPMYMEVSGTFHQIASFFDEVGRLDRIVNIKNIQVEKDTQKADSDKSRISASCMAVTYRYLSDSERENKKKANSKRKKS